MLNQTVLGYSELNGINFAAFLELRKLLLNVAMKHMDSIQDKKVSKEIPDSYGLLFFEQFNGIQIQGYENVVVKEICKQIEKQLFISGKYKLQK